MRYFSAKREIRDLFLLGEMCETSGYLLEICDISLFKKDIGDISLVKGICEISLSFKRGV